MEQQIMTDEERKEAIERLEKLDEGGLQGAELEARLERMDANKKQAEFAAKRNRIMTVGELMTNLAKLPKDTAVCLASDEEGNSYSLVQGAT
ncbi:MAG: hypothetical protein LBP79_05085 [Clostridiales bacterium]|nr:hypothetical protein [Clostridiales bacterium]